MAVISTPLSHGEGFELNRFSWQANQLVGWWPLGAYPEVTDKSLYRNDGASEVGCGGGGLCDSSTPRATSPASHGQRRALLFDASSKDIVQVPTNPLYSGGSGGYLTESPTRTVSCWVLCNTKSGGFAFVSNSTSEAVGQPGWMLGRTGSSDYFRYASDGTSGGIATGTTNFSTGVWYHLVGTHTGSTATLYVNGVAEAATAWSNWSISTQPLSFGKWYSNYDCCYFDGLLDDVRLYRRALGANEVAAIYNQTKDGSYGELAAKPRRFYNIPLAAAEPEAVAATHKQIDLVEGPSSEFDVITELRDEHRGGTGRGAFCPVGVVNESAFGTRIAPSTQAGLNRLDERFVRGTNQGDPIA